MSKPIYLYIDDENGSSETSTLHGFNDTDVIEVKRFNLSEFRDFGRLKKELERACHKNEFDGLIIDLRLDGAGKDRTEFNATAITSELRSVAARGEIRSFPIVLCSTEEKIKQTYDSDKTSHDLFDYKVSKSNPEPDWIKISTKLKSLADGYRWLQISKRELKDIVGIGDIQNLDTRITDKFSSFSATYDFTHFVIKNFFHQTNPLINEKVLAARLGIDMKKTPKNAWEKLSLEILNDIKYNGLFKLGWRRWWANDLELWFNKMSGEKLAFIDAEKRVEILKKETGLEELTHALPLKFCNSSEFWSICEGYKEPIDPLEAFKIFTTVDLKPWQESKVISLIAILQREGFTDRGLKPDLSENERIEYTKKEIGV